MADHRPLDPVALRRDFPLFERDFGGRTLAYLDSAATSLKPRPVLDAVAGYNERFTANVHRGIYTTGEEATAAYEGARASVARFLNARESAEIVFVRNATEAINLVANTWGRRTIGQADTIILSELEHHSIMAQTWIGGRGGPGWNMARSCFPSVRGCHTLPQRWPD